MSAERKEEDAGEDGKSFRLPGWIKDVAMKMLPWAMGGLVAASVGLYTDNIGNKRDISRETWRNDQQDARLTRFEGKQDKIEERISEMRDDQEAFKGMLIDRLDALIEKRTRRER